MEGERLGGLKNGRGRKGRGEAGEGNEQSKLCGEVCFIGFRGDRHPWLSAGGVLGPQLGNLGSAISSPSGQQSTDRKCILDALNNDSVRLKI